MQTLMIKDLAVAEDLDRKAMATVRGGQGLGLYTATSSYPGMPSSWGPMYDYSKNDFNFTASQSLGQSQSTIVNNGNNVAFASGITANVNPTQRGSNNINFG